MSRKPVQDQAEASAGTVGTHDSQKDGGGRMGPRTRNKGETCRGPKNKRCQGDTKQMKGHSVNRKGKHNPHVHPQPWIWSLWTVEYYSAFRFAFCFSRQGFSV